jgi:hypothetical protein
MRRFSAWAVGLVAAAVVIGCGPGKEIPDEVPGPKALIGPASDPLGPAASASDPEAKAVVDRAVKAITENVPGGLGKAKVSRAVYKGEMQLPQRSAMTKMERTIEAVWPDQALVIIAFKEEQPQTAAPSVSLGLNHNEGWMKNGSALVPGNPADMAQIIQTDVTAQYWLMLGPALAETRLVAYDLKKTAGGSTVKLAFPNMPVLRVTFEDKSGLPVQVEYNPVEQQQRLHKVLKMSDHKPTGGLLLPAALELFQNDRLTERWATESWEFPEKIDPSHFEAPK